MTLVQEPNTGLAEDVAATKRAIDQQTGPVVLVGHSYGGSVITEAGIDPKVGALVYVAALQPDVGEASGQLLSKFAAPNNAMQAASNRGTEDKFLFLPPAQFREKLRTGCSCAGSSIPGRLAAAARSESSGCTCLCGCMAYQAYLCHPDHLGSHGEP